MKKIFIAGHKGMVGSAIFRKLKNKSNKIVIADKKKLNLLNQKSVLSFFKKNKFNEVYLCAAKVGGIHANNTYLADFIYQNLEIQSNLIHSAYLTKVKKLMFLGSSCVYPKKPKIPIKEEYLLTSELENTNEMYAIAKIAGLKMCKAYNTQFKTDFRAIMPTNLYGQNDNYDSLNSHVLAALIKKIVLAKKQNKKSFIVWGTGKPKREFLHVDDLSDALYFLANNPIEETIIKHLDKDINLEKTDKLLKIILFSAVFELIFKHNTPKNVVISEYVKASEFFLEKSQISYLNAILDKLSKLIRKE